MYRYLCTNPASFVPAGLIIPWETMADSSKVAAKVRVPMLSIRSDSYSGETPPKEFSFGTGFVRLHNTPVLTLRLQLDAHQFYWLSHPKDPELWRVLDEWDAAGSAMFLIETGSMQFVYAVEGKAVDPRMKQLRQFRGGYDAKAFMDEVVELASTRILDHQATSDIAGIRALEHVEVCVLATRATLEARPFTNVLHS